MKYTGAFGDFEAGYKTFSFIWHRLDLKEPQVQFPDKVSPKFVVSYAVRNFRFVGLM